MIDLHSHILPGIDDGAEGIDEALALLRAEQDDGVDTVVLTPHFRTHMANIEMFLQNRNGALELLRSNASDRPVKLLTGSETAFSPELLKMNIDPLCIEGTKNILIEMPMDHYPSVTREVFYELTLLGYTPIVAHAERHQYFMRDPGQLAALIRGGAYIQVNADSLLRGRQTSKAILRMIATNLVHVIATDTHSMDSRPPLLGQAMAFIEKKLGKDTAQRLIQNAQWILNNEVWIVPEPG
ncbi:MAG: hypothetical protein FWH06_01335 [Oscillospiraceae bacterium]|nr:hypothetical protein [Oscillospiraceae bacterium]